MARRARKAPVGGVDVVAVVAGYERWLSGQPLAARTRDAYLAQVAGFVGWLADSEHGSAALVEGPVRDWAVRDYKRFMKTTKRWAPTSVNQALAAIDNFYRSLGAGRPQVAREELAQVAPRALEAAEQRSFLRAWSAARRPAIGRSPPCSSTPGCGSPNWPHCSWTTWRCRRAVAA